MSRSRDADYSRPRRELRRSRSRERRDTDYVHYNERSGGRGEHDRDRDYHRRHKSRDYEPRHRDPRDRAFPDDRHYESSRHHRHHHHHDSRADRDFSSRAPPFRSRDHDHRHSGPGARESSVVMIRGLNPLTTQERLTDEIKAHAPIEGARLIRNKETGESRCFAFVDFASVEAAKNFINQNKGLIEIDGNTCQLDYSKTPKENHGPGGSDFHSDWFCPKCNGVNFARRVSCFVCQEPKPANPVLAPRNAGRPAHDNPAVPVLVVRELSPFTTQEVLAGVFQQFPGLKEVRLIRDRITGESRCFAFVEFFTVENAAHAMRNSSMLRIDDSSVRIAYAKRNFNPSGPPSNPGASLAVSQATWSAASGASNWNTEQTLQQLKEAGYVYDETSGYYYNATTKYYFDMSTGYYYDSNTGVYYYYDSGKNQYVPVTQGQENAGEAKPEGSTAAQDALAGPEVAAPEQTESAQAKPEKKKKKKTKKKRKGAPSKTIQGKKMTREMEKWQRRTEELQRELEEEKKRKELEEATQVRTGKIKFQLTGGNSALPGLEASDKAAPSPETKEETSQENETKGERAAIVAGGVVVACAEPTTSVPPPEPQSRPVPNITLGNVCLLCKRKFADKDALQTHVDLSELHKHNLELARAKALQRERVQAAKKKNKKKRPSTAKPKPGKNKMAKQTHPLVPKSNRPSMAIGSMAGMGGIPGGLAPDAAPTPSGLAGGIGAKMMAKMGWKEGQGLGKSSDGRTNIVELQSVSERAGLGASAPVDPTRHQIHPGDSYRTAALKKARARYEAMANVRLPDT